MFRLTARRAGRPVRAKAIVALLLSAGSLRVACGREPPQSEPVTQRASDALREFQPGVQIDWAARAVRLRGRVVLRDGALEYFACFAGKEHESIVRLDAWPEHVYMALGLVGVLPGRPAEWDEQRQRFVSPAGELVDVAVDWFEGGAARGCDACDWLLEIEYARVPLPRPWVFAGSQRLPDGRLSAAQTGAGIALVDDPDCLLAMTRPRSSANAELWVRARTEAIPAEGTNVTVVLRAAARRRHTYEIDFRGASSVDGRFASRADLLDLLEIEVRQFQGEPLTILAAGTPACELYALRKLLDASGLGPQKVRIAAPSSQPASDRANP